jgi:predicted lipid-binding transport protein (Tim44 family)
MKRVSWIVAVFLVGSLLASCGSQEQTPAAPTAGGAETTTGSPTSSTTGSLSDPKSSIAYQFELVKAGDLEKLKECLTPRVRDELTAEIVEKAKGEAANMTMDDLYASEEMGEADGKKTAKVKMKNDRTLTTLIEEDGKWLADTIWFK